MNHAQFLTKLADLMVCEDARAWVIDNKLTAKQAWNTCPRGDWLLWLAAKAVIDRKLLVMAACACARTVLKYVPAGEDRPRIAIEAAESWCRGEATIELVLAAATTAAARDADAAYAASNAAYAAIAAATTAAARDADAAYAASNAAYAAIVADYAAIAADYTTDADVDADAAAAETAEIVREMISWSAVRAALGGAK